MDSPGDRVQGLEEAGRRHDLLPGDQRPPSPHPFAGVHGAGLHGRGKPNAPSGSLTFNEFFARDLNPGMRPVMESRSNLIISSPADLTCQHSYDIGDQSQIPPTTVKGTHTYGSMDQPLSGSRFADTFARGTFVHYMLPPWAYHRFHVPVSGRIKKSFVIQGTVVMKVDLVDHGPVSSDATTTGFEFSATREVLTIDSLTQPAEPRDRRRHPRRPRGERAATSRGGRRSGTRPM